MDDFGDKHVKMSPERDFWCGPSLVSDCTGAHLNPFSLLWFYSLFAGNQLVSPDTVCYLYLQYL